MNQLRQSRYESSQFTFSKKKKYDKNEKINDFQWKSDY